MHVCADHALRHFDEGATAQAHVFADGSDQRGDFFGHRPLRARIGRRNQARKIAARFERDAAGGLHEALEGLVPGNEVRFGVDLDERAFVSVDDDADQPFGRDPAGLLGGRGQPLGPQPVDGGFDVAAGFGQRLLAIHHPGAGFIAQFLDQCGRDFRHVALFRSVSLDSFG